MTDSLHACIGDYIARLVLPSWAESEECYVDGEAVKAACDDLGLTLTGDVAAARSALVRLEREQKEAAAAERAKATRRRLREERKLEKRIEALKPLALSGDIPAREELTVVSFYNGRHGDRPALREWLYENKLVARPEVKA